MAEKYLLKDKVAIVTGGAAGIGYAIASEFAKEGAKVVIAELREERGVQAAAEIAEATGAEVRPICTDVRKEDQIIHCVEETVESFGSVDILINNAS